MRCRSLDLEKPPLEQGFEAHSFDIVLASDAVHATARVHDSLSHLRSLLAPEGLLILLEIDRPTRWVDLVFGLTPGWWRFQDKDLRPSHALLDRSRGAARSELLDSSTSKHWATLSGRDVRGRACSWREHRPAA